MLDVAFLIPAFPLAGSVTLMVFGRRGGERRVGRLATTAMLGSFVCAVLVFLGLLSEPASQRRFVQTLWEWVPAGELSVDVGLFADPLSITMALFITGVGTLIHIYAINYMHGDEHFARFFIYLNLFVFSMLILVLGDNMALTFLGWEGVGACSYLLISFWFTDVANASAGKKAFITNRVGDWGFLVAMFVTFNAIGSIRYTDLIGNAAGLNESTATAIVVLLLVAAAGKSAQIPLFIWLPDAMAGPTPVSALIHAATMVTAGVYLMVRVNPVIAEAATWTPDLIAYLGVITALVAALIAVAQDDIKKVLAYSTVSQLGYMFLAIGTGAYVAAVFHMITHAFFKGLLFLGAGSVIHAMDHDQNMRHFGGLRRFMPITSATFIVGWLAIAGVPPLSGFWSKDEILAHAYDRGALLWLLGLVTAVLTAFYMSRQVFMTFFGRYRYRDLQLSEIEAISEKRLDDAKASIDATRASVAEAEAAADKAETKMNRVIADLAVREAELATVDPADVRAYRRADRNLRRANAGVQPARDSLSDAKAALTVTRAELEKTRADVARARHDCKVLAGGVIPDDLHESYLPETLKARRALHPSESRWQMTMPLIVLAVLAAVAGVINLPFTKDLHFLANWLEPSMFGNESHLEISGGVSWVLAFLAVAGGLAGIALAVAVYLAGRFNANRIELPILSQGFRYDEAVATFMGGPGRKGFQAIARFDSVVVDGAVNGVAKTVRSVGKGLRRAQSGLVRSYAALVAIGAVGLVAYFLVRAAP